MPHYFRTAGFRNILILSALLLALGISISYATSVEVSRDIPGSITINLLSPQQSADLNDSRRVDTADLLAILRRFNTRHGAAVPEDINHDGIIDVLDLVLVARYFGEEA